MDKTFVKWFSRLILAADIVLLLASTPHIAAWFAHNDHTSNILDTAYSWVIGYMIALAIDGTSVMVLYGLLGLFKAKIKAPGKKTGLIICLVFLALLSTYINWQYDVQNATDAFAKADAILVAGVPLGNVNPLIGGSFALLNIFYAMLSSLVQSEEKPAMTDAEYEAEKKRIGRERELRELRKANSQGILAMGKEVVLGQGQGTDDLLNKALAYLRDARELLPVDQEGRAVQALSSHLNIRSKNVLPVLIQARSIIEREDQEADTEDATLEQEEELNASSPDQEAQQEDMLMNLQGRETVALAVAARVLNCQESYVVRLRNAGKLKHGSKRKDLITVASLRSYLATRKRSTVPTTEKLPAQPTLKLVPDETGVDKLDLTIEAMKDRPEITDEELAVVLGLKRPASARFWRLKVLAMKETEAVPV